MGDGPEQLFLHRAATRESWFAFQRLADLKRVAASTYDPVRRRNKVSSFSLPEILVGSALRAVLPPFVRITAHATLLGSSRICDFELLHCNDRIVRVEVTGMMTAAGKVLTATGARYRERQPERLADYGRAGVPPPLICYADQIGHRAGLREIIAAVLDSLGLSCCRTD